MTWTFSDSGKHTKIATKFKSVAEDYYDTFGIENEACNNYGLFTVLLKKIKNKIKKLKNIYFSLWGKIVCCVF